MLAISPLMGRGGSHNFDSIQAWKRVERGSCQAVAPLRTRVLSSRRHVACDMHPIPTTTSQRSGHRSNILLSLRIVTNFLLFFLRLLWFEILIKKETSWACAKSDAKPKANSSRAMHSIPSSQAQGQGKLLI